MTLLDDEPEIAVDPADEVARLEARIEELGEVAERCRKIILASRVAIAAGVVIMLATLLGLLRFDQIAVLGSLAAVIGGVVVLGSNASTLKQTEAAMKADEARRLELIGAMELRPVGQATGTRIDDQRSVR